MTMTIAIFALITLFAFASMYVGLRGFGLVSAAKTRDTLRRRLVVADVPISAAPEEPAETPAAIRTSRTADRAKAFYENSDPDDIARLRRMLMQAAVFRPDAVGRFLIARIALMIVGIVAGSGFVAFSSFHFTSAKGIALITAASLVGYFIPNIWLNRRRARCNEQYRHGFPDFMDLMIVCANAGLSIDASIERVSREMKATHANLSENLTLLSLELRAGRHLAEAMGSLADRLGVDEVRGFVTLLVQSRELGTSLSDTLRVFSEDMRDKRVMRAEEKAHALPAKMTIPVTMCILPVVVMVAIIPAIVRWQMQ